MKTAARIKDITNSHIGAALDKMEKPQKMIDQLIRDMEDAMLDLKASVRERIALKTQTEIERNCIRDRIERWESRAQIAVEKDRDDLAREALLEKMRAQKSLELIERDLEHHDRLIEETRKSVTEIEERLELVRQRQRLLIQRGIHATEQKRARETLRSAESTEAYRRFMELEAKIERLEAEAEVAGFGMAAAHQETAGSEQDFARMESDRAIDEELASLKAKTAKNTKKQDKE